MAYIQKRSGSYRARWTDPVGKVHSRTFKRKADAERFLREVDADMVRGLWVDPRDAEMPLAQWAEEFLRLCRRLSPTTQETYKRDIDKYIVPRFGHYRLGQLPADQIENWLNDEVDAGIAPSSVHRHYRTLRRMLEVAVEKQKLLINPCSRVKPPRVPKTEMAFLDWNDVIRLADAHGDRFRPMIYLAVDSGMRWSELVGLRRSNLDLTRGKVRVTEQLVQMQDGSFLRKEPKTPSSVRSITLSAFTVELLVEHLRATGCNGRDDLVFTNGAGNPIASSSFLTGHFRKAQTAVNIRCRVHDLRHTSVALAIASGAHPKAIQARMGHSSINVTLDRYGHLFPELDEGIASAFGKSLEQARTAQLNNVVQLPLPKGSA